MDGDFKTFSEYMKKEDDSLTASMEDYLEMICRLSVGTGFVRIHDLSEALSVQPPSATKMVQKLSEAGLIRYEKYGFIMLEEKGRAMGEALLRRHRTIEELLRILGVPGRIILEETEKAEHTLRGETVRCIERFIGFIRENPDVATRYGAYREEGNAQGGAP